MLCALHRGQPVMQPFSASPLPQAHSEGLISDSDAGTMAARVSDAANGNGTVPGSTGI